MDWIRRLYSAFKASRDFDIAMKSLYPLNEQRFKVAITKDQINILYRCAWVGILNAGEIERK